LTTSRSGEFTLTDAEGTLKRRNQDRQEDPLSFSLLYVTQADQPASDDTMTVPGPILTVNSVSNPAGVRQVERSPALNVNISRSQTATKTGPGRHRAHTTSSERRYSFDDESQKFDWSATLNLLSRLDDGQSTTATTRQRSETVDTRVRQDAIEPTLVATHVERSTDWEATLPKYPRDRSGSTGRDDWRSRTLQAQRGYSSDSENSSDWLERQQRRLRQRKSTGSSTSSTVKARIVFPPPRTELERRLIDELRTSQERLNRDKSVQRNARNGLYSSCSLPRPASSSSLSRGHSLANGFYDHSFDGDVGRYSTLPGKGRAVVGGVQRASSELDFSADTTRRVQHNDIEFDRHRSMSSLRPSDVIGEQRLVKSTVSRRTGAFT